jgi:hypothetical protein
MPFFKRRDAAPKKDWYRDASEDARREYDAFGPWVYEVLEARDLPPRFRAVFGPWGGSDLVLKIPVDVERRNARPGQDLYRQVLEIKGDTLRSLSLADERVEERSVSIAALQALTLYQVLLLGTFSAVTPDSEFGFLFNTVSSPLVRRFVDLLRERVAPAGQPPLGSSLPVKNFFFQNLVREHQRHNPATRVVYCDEPGQKMKDERGRSRRGLGVLVLQTGSELLVLDAGTPWRRAGRAVYGSRCVFVPKKSWTSLALKPAELRLSLPCLELAFPLLDGPGALAEILG